MNSIQFDRCSEDPHLDWIEKEDLKEEEDRWNMGRGRRIGKEGRKVTVEELRLEEAMMSRRKAGRLSEIIRRKRS